MLGRPLAFLAVGASCLAFAGAAAAGPPVQVNIYLPSYGPPSSPPPAPPQAAGQSAQSAIATANAVTLQAEVAIAQAAAYQRYLQYVAVTSGGGGRGGGDPSQYFTNGASATTVPSGSSYFSNGAEAMRVPGPPSAALPPAPPVPPVTPQASPPPPLPPSPPATPPPSAPLAPYWWTDGVPAAAATPAAAPPTPPPSPPPADSREDHPAPAMSFAEWLQSMGASAPDVAAAEATPAADLAEAPIAEPAAAVLEVRQRLPSVLREKPRERVLAGDGSSGLVATMLGTFAAGVILGALAMKRPRPRPRAE